MRVTSSLSSLIILATACSSATDLTTSSPSPNVVVTAVGVRVANRDSVTITITNRGVGDAFLLRCGQGPRLLTQQHIGELWVGGVQNFMCPVPAAPGQVRLAPGEQIVLTRVFDVTGRYRVLVTVGTNDDLADAASIYSNGFAVP
jgi:hypothetical protein